MNLFTKIANLFSKQQKLATFKVKVGGVYLTKNGLEYTVNDIRNERVTYSVKHPSGSVTVGSADRIFFEDLQELGFTSSVAIAAKNGDYPQVTPTTIFFPPI